MMKKSSIENAPLSTSLNSPTIRCRTASTSYKERSNKIHNEISKANEARLVKEVERPKILIDEVRLDKPRPASFYIAKARTNFIRKSSLKANTLTPTDRNTLFGSLLSTQIFKKSQNFRSNDRSLIGRKTSLKESLESDNYLPE